MEEELLKHLTKAEKKMSLLSGRLGKKSMHLLLVNDITKSLSSMRQLLESNGTVTTTNVTTNTTKNETPDTTLDSKISNINDTEFDTMLDDILDSNNGSKQDISILPSDKSLRDLITRPVMTTLCVDILAQSKKKSHQQNKAINTI